MPRRGEPLDRGAHDLLAVVGHRELPLQEPTAPVDAIPLRDHVERVEEGLDGLQLVAPRAGALRNHSSLNALIVSRLSKRVGHEVRRRRQLGGAEGVAGR